MSIWSISGSLRLSQNFVRNWKFSWPRSLAKFQILTEISDFHQFFKTFISDLWMNCKSQNGILGYSYVDLKDLWKFEVESKFCQKLIIFMTAVLSEISDFDQFFKTLISDLWMNCKSQNGILGYSYVDLKDFWKFAVESKFCQKLKIFMTAVFSEISDFVQFFKTFILDSWMNCSSQNGILECFYVDLKDFWKFDVKSKCCQKLKIFMTAVLSEISDFHKLFKTFISDLLVDCNS